MLSVECQRRSHFDAYGRAALLRSPQFGTRGNASLPRRMWTGMRVARPLLRFGRPACVSQHLCPQKRNPVRESHSLTWFCRPLPGLFGQRDGKKVCSKLFGKEAVQFGRNHDTIDEGESPIFSHFLRGICQPGHRGAIKRRGETDAFYTRINKFRYAE